MTEKIIAKIVDAAQMLQLALDGDGVAPGQDWENIQWAINMLVEARDMMGAFCTGVFMDNDTLKKTVARLAEVNGAEYGGACFDDTILGDMQGYLKDALDFIGIVESRAPDADPVVTGDADIVMHNKQTAINGLSNISDAITEAQTAAVAQQLQFKQGGAA